MTGWLTRHRVLVWLVTVGLAGSGAILAARLPSGIYPEVEFPRIVVVAREGDAPPAVTQVSLTRPLETALATVLGVERIRSRTIRGAVELSLQFTPGSDMWRALQLVESRVGDARATLPPSTDVVVERLTTTSFPVITFNLTGDIDSRRLRDLGELVLRPAISRVRGVGRVEVLGGDVREVEVIVDPAKAAALRLSPSKVADKIRAATTLQAVGRFDDAHSMVTVVASGAAADVADVAALPVAVGPDGSSVPLSAIATVVEGAQDRLLRVSGPGGPTVLVSVSRLPGASTPDVVARVRAAVAESVATFPAGVKLSPVYDQAALVDESMRSVRDAILIGIGLCVAVIALFLGDLRAGLGAALSVPLTLGITFVPLALFGESLNLMSMGGLAVAIGLVIDDAIVVVEAIRRRRRAGASDRAGRPGGGARSAGRAGGDHRDDGGGVRPARLAAGGGGPLLRRAGGHRLGGGSPVAGRRADRRSVGGRRAGCGRAAARRRRPRGTSAATRGPWSRCCAVAGWGWPSRSPCWRGVRWPPARCRPDFCPAWTRGRSSSTTSFRPAPRSPTPTPWRARSRRCCNRSPRWRPIPAEPAPSLARRPPPRSAAATSWSASSRRAARRRSVDEIIAAVRARVEREAPEARVEFVQVLQDVLNDLSGTPRPIEVKLFGDDYAVLRAKAQELAGRLGDVPGLVDLYAGFDGDAPELRLRVDQSRAARLGTDAAQVTADLEAGLRGVVASVIRRPDRPIGVRVRYPDAVRFDEAQIRQLPVLAGRDGLTSVAAVTDAERAGAPSALVRENLRPVVILTADHEGRDLGSVARDVRSRIAAVKLPEGYASELGGQYRAQQETFRDLARVLGFGVLGVLAVLLAQFRRARIAMVVLASVPLAVVGALLTLLITGVPLNASSLMGCVLLVGLVVKNGILLLEQAESLWDGGATLEAALVEAGTIRVRPILMTTLATVAGLAPLALGIGPGAEIQRPLALAVVGGLVGSAAVSLFIVPSLVELVFSRRKPSTARAEPQS